MNLLLSLVHDAPTTADVPTMRRAVRAAAEVSDTGVDLDDLELAAAELIANAVVHGDGPVTVTVERVAASGIRLSVTDTAPDALPPPPREAALAETGRGLMVVAAIASTWGWRVDDQPLTKTVWAEFIAVG